MRWLSILLLLAQPADVGLTWACMVRGGVEQNPLLSPWLGTPESFGALLALKLSWVVVALLAVALLEARGRCPKWPMWGLRVATACCWAAVGWGVFQLAL